MLGLSVGLIGLVTGGMLRCKEGTLQFANGAVSWALKHFPGRPSAMTLGHVIIGQSEELLEYTHPHEMIHVHQYERWGPFFLPAYLGCSLVLYLKGKNAYHDNPFEIEAFENDGLDWN